MPPLAENTNPEWVKYRNHRRAKVKDWEASRAKKSTEKGDAQYSPVDFGTDTAVEELEFHCLKKGKLIRESENRITLYCDMERIIGACSGEFTQFVFVEMTCGKYHGRPISPSALKTLGVTL